MPVIYRCAVQSPAVSLVSGVLLKLGGEDKDAERAAKPVSRTSSRGRRAAQGQRRWLAIGATAVTLGILFAGCGGDDEEAEKPAKPVSGTFVGVEGRELFVAVVAAERKSGASKRQVKVYVCDSGRTSDQLSEWFPGAAAANEVKLTSQSRDAKVELTLSDEGATGTVTLPGGRKVPFRLERARGIAGLYNVSALPGGRLRGSSATGGRLEGQYGERAATTGLRPATLTITPRDGEARTLKVSSANGIQTGSGNGRLIVLADGRMHGGDTKTALAGGSQPRPFMVRDLD